MGRNAKEVYDDNPSTTASANDLLYLAKSPYGSGNDSAIKYDDLLTQLGSDIGLASTDQVGGLDTALNDKASLSNNNSFSGQNDYSGDVNLAGNTTVNQILNPVFSATNLTSALSSTSGTLTAAQIIGGGIYFNPTGGANATWQFPTGDDIENGVSFSPAVNQSFFLFLMNQSSSGTIFFTENTNLTFGGLTDAAVLKLLPKSYLIVKVEKISDSPDPLIYTVVGASIGINPGVTPVNTVTASTYTFQLTDIGGYVGFNSTSDQTVTVPKDATLNFPIGATIDIGELDVGVLTFEPEDGTITILSPGNSLVSSGKGAAFSIKKIAANLWHLTGGLA